MKGVGNEPTIIILSPAIHFTTVHSSYGVLDVLQCAYAIHGIPTCVPHSNDDTGVQNKRIHGDSLSIGDENEVKVLTRVHVLRALCNTFIS